MNDTSKTKKILLLGDSIRRSYQPIVAEKLKGKAEIMGSKENGQFSLYTLSTLFRWLNEFDKPDIIHWNNGIHDVGYNPQRRPVQIPIDDYTGNLSLIIEKLRETGAKIIWATSTPVHPDRPFSEKSWSWKNEEIDLYNEAALKIMKKENIPVNDLHSVIAADYDRYLFEDMLHLSEEGKEACAEKVAEELKKYL